VLVEEDHLHAREAVARTATLLADESVPALYEGGFLHEGVLIRAAVLVRSPDGGWDLVEVKSGTRLKDEHLTDVAIQVWVLRGAGLDVRRAGVLTLDREYVWEGGEYDLGTLSRLHDCTDAVEALLPGIAAEVARLHALLAAGAPPAIAPGAQCTVPYECPFLAHCSKGVVAPEWPLALLPSLRGRRREGLEALGVDDVRDIPADYALTRVQEVVRTAVRSGTDQVHGDLAGALSSLEFPIRYLDFEAANPALPRYAGTRPCDAVSFGLSVHTEDAGRMLTHAGYLHPDGSDPRQPLAVALLDALEGGGSIVVYSACERTVITALADHGARVVKVEPPAFGAQTESALAAWGFAGDEIASLKAHGAIGRSG